MVLSTIARDRRMNDVDDDRISFPRITKDNEFPNKPSAVNENISGTLMIKRTILLDCAMSFKNRE
jgi:hypothetical protein